MRKIYPLLSLIALLSCNSQEKADLVVYNATVYTVDSGFTVTEAIAIKDGKIIATGKTDELLNRYDAAEKTDAQGKFIYPGLIDAHSHFYGYGLSLQTADLVGTTSWQEILDKLKSFAADHSEGWLIGRGWDQNDWTVKEFPDNEQLNALFPNRPVMLRRIDGHAAIANQKALDMAGIKSGDKLTGGTVEVKNGKLTGLLIDNAIGLVGVAIPPPSESQMLTALLRAQENCFAVGLTTVVDCGLDAKEVLFIDTMQKEGLVKMRIYAMLSDAGKNYDFILKRGKIKTDLLNVRSFKVYADGALGSRGACLLEP